MSSDFTRRFTDRVQDYLRYRPKYPPQIIEILKGVMGPGSKVADLGCGTGFLAELLLENGCTVFGVEPNPAMRAAGEEYLARFPNFHSIEGAAEATTLPDQSVDCVTAGQAMHWFDKERTRAEIIRIARKPCWFVCIRNSPDPEESDFMREYEELLHSLLPQYAEVCSRYIPLLDYLGEGDGYHVATLPNEQEFDEEGLIGRVMSSSYAPKEGAVHEELVKGLKELFRRHSRRDRITFHYITTVEYAELGGAA